MTGLLIQVGLSNLVFSAALASVAYAVHRYGRYPSLAHLLWVFVLVKVITPPLFILPIALGPSTGEHAMWLPADGSGDAPALAGAAPPAAAIAWLAEHGVTALLLAWIFGCLLVLAASGLRIGRFSRLLAQTSTEAPAAIQDVAGSVACQIGLGSVPVIRQSRARLSPMTWWTGGRTQIVLPEALLEQVGGQELRWVLAHELAHVKRRDHLVRWFEWLAGVSFWWNPVVWWARRNLRLAEEDACDALVLSRIEGQPRSYGMTLLAVVELLAIPSARTPAVATGIDAAASLERRLTRIVSPIRPSQAPRWLVVGLTIVVLALMWVGVGSTAEHEATIGEPERADVSEVADGPSSELRHAKISAVLHEGAVNTVPVAGKLADGDGSQGNIFIGTAEADTYTGSDRGETIVGRAGTDELSGGAGRDTIRGGKGRDTIRGGKGDDTIAGGGGRDTIDAGAGNDVVKTWGDGVADRVDCGRGSRDRAVVDSADSVERCEVVVIRDPS